MTSDRKEPRAKRHHLVPKFYLRRFADEKDRLLVTDVREARSFISSPENSAVEMEFNTVETVEGPSDVVERAFSVLEGHVAEVLRTIDEGSRPFSSDDQEKLLLTEFIVLQLLRVRAFRHMLNEGTDAVGRRIATLVAADPDR
jgi:hypothetical protein